MSTSSQGEDREERRRSNLTGRAAVLALVVCLLSISLAYPLREYLAQRGDIAGYRGQVAEQERERLHYVMPGETSYVVLEADDAPSPDGAVEPEKAAAARSPWFTDLWRSVEVAGGTQKPTR